MKQDEKQIMDELKREYESIPVPPQARARIMQGINQLKCTDKINRTIPSNRYN